MQLRIGGLGVLSLEDRALMAFVGTQFQIRNAQDNKSKKVVMWWDNTSMSDMQHSAAKEVAQIHLGKVQDNCAYDDAAIEEAISRISKMSMRELMEPHNAHYYHEYNDNCDSEAAQALAATNQKGANDVLTVRPNREETILNDWELSFAIHQRFGTLNRLLGFRMADPIAWRAQPQNSQGRTLQVAVTAVSSGMIRLFLHICRPLKPPESTQGQKFRRKILSARSTSSTPIRSPNRLQLSASLLM